MNIKINFVNDANRGSFAIDALAQTLGGNWSEKSSTNNGGIITDVDADNQDWTEKVLKSDVRVDSYTIRT